MKKGKSAISATRPVAQQGCGRRDVLRAIGSAAAAGSCAALAPLSAFAQSERPTTLVVPYAPGGTSDMLGRLIAQQLAGKLGRGVIVENRAGAGTAVGAAYVARAAADGNTLLLATSTTMAINPSLYPKLPYNPAKDFAPVGLVAAVPLIVVVHPSVNVKTLGELVALARRKPDMLMYGSAGNGSPQHLGAEMFRSVTDIEMRHVPYKGTAPAMTDLVGGQINVMFTDIAPALPHVKSGRLRVLAVTTASRHPLVPDVPTVAESGIPGTKGFEAVAWQGIVAPAGTPASLVADLDRNLAEVLNDPQVQAKFHAMGIEPRTSSPERFAEYIVSETARWGAIIRRSGATVD